MDLFNFGPSTVLQTKILFYGSLADIYKYFMYCEMI